MTLSRSTAARNWLPSEPVPEKAPELETNSLPLHLQQIALVALLLFGPVAFGATVPWAILVVQIGAALLFALWCVEQISSPRILVLRSPLFTPIAAFGLLVLLQLVFRRSAYLDATLAESMRYVAYGLLLFLAVQRARLRTDFKYFAMALMGMGFLLAVQAMLQGFSGSQKLLWLVMPSSINAGVFGSYANHNHYAGLMELLIPFPLILSLFGVWKGEKRILCIFATVVMTASLFLSKSRGGMVAFAVQMIFITFIALRRRTKNLVLGLTVACVLMAGILWWLDSQGIIGERISTLANPIAAADIRISILRDGWRMFAARPILGWGLGVFPVAYPQFRSFATDSLINQAHNDYLQALVETGLLGFALVCWFIFLLYRNGLPHIRSCGYDLKAAVRTAALVGCTGLLVHSFTDFNLHIPANAALFFVLAGIATTSNGNLQTSKLQVNP